MTEVANNPSMKNEDTPPQGLQWGDGKASEAKPATPAKPKEEMKGVFASTRMGAAIAPPQPAGSSSDLSVVSSLFGGQAVPAPTNLDEAASLNEAEISKLEAAKKNDLLNDRMAVDEDEATKVIPIGVVANDAPKPQLPPRKVTLVGAGVMAPPGPLSNVPKPAGLPAAPPPSAAGGMSLTVTPASVAVAPPPSAASAGTQPAARAMALDSTILAGRMDAPPPPAAPAPAPEPVAVAQPEPEDADEDAAPPPPAAKAQRASKPKVKAASAGRTSKPGKGAPPPPPVEKVSLGRKILVGFSAATIFVSASIGGALAGLYKLPPPVVTAFGLDTVLGSPDRILEPAPEAPAKPKPSLAQAPEAKAATPPEAAKPEAKVEAKAEPTVEAKAEAKPVEAKAEPKAEPKPEAKPVEAKAEPKPVEAKAEAKAEPKPEPKAVEAKAEPKVVEAKAEPKLAAAPAPVAAEPEKAASASGDPVEAARAKLTAKDFAGAEAMCRAILDKDKTEHHAMEVLARALIAEHKGAEAVAYAEQIVKRRPKRASYRLVLGDAKRAAGDEAGAQQAYRDGLAIDPNDYDLNKRVGGLAH
ncbi:MAG TPA: hypothetical protein VHM19_11405 [Polyangiales bacterium]|nr:hypothetical protein [Polyangiales bacterium]